MVMSTSLLFHSAVLVALCAGPAAPTTDEGQAESPAPPAHAAASAALKRAGQQQQQQQQDTWPLEFAAFGDPTLSPAAPPKTDASPSTGGEQDEWPVDFAAFVGTPTVAPLPSTAAAEEAEDENSAESATDALPMISSLAPAPVADVAEPPPQQEDEWSVEFEAFGAMPSPSASKVDASPLEGGEQDSWPIDLQATFTSNSSPLQAHASPTGDNEQDKWPADFESFITTPTTTPPSFKTVTSASPSREDEQQWSVDSELNTPSPPTSKNAPTLLLGEEENSEENVLNTILTTMSPPDMTAAVMASPVEERAMLPVDFEPFATALTTLPPTGTTSVIPGGGEDFETFASTTATVPAGTENAQLESEQKQEVNFETPVASPSIAAALPKQEELDNSRVYFESFAEPLPANIASAIPLQENEAIPSAPAASSPTKAIAIPFDVDEQEWPVTFDTISAESTITSHVDEEKWPVDFKMSLSTTFSPSETDATALEINGDSPSVLDVTKNGNQEHDDEDTEQKPDDETDEIRKAELTHFGNTTPPTSTLGQSDIDGDDDWADDDAWASFQSAAPAVEDPSNNQFLLPTKRVV